ncbi:MAG TPA: methyltransferase domain-containing protein [Candidatus Krumholzibacteria bacterium]|nr:methyltransferase domain-containing protein [Candidatus Krumholzibacteria bacterium]
MRTPDSIRRHYEVEKALADRLRASTSREERARIYATMYDELFAAVPDHPRLTGVKDPAHVARQNQSRLDLVRHYLRPGARVLDIGAGDCTFSRELAARARAVYALEISADSVAVDDTPANMTLVIYDGFNLPFAPGSLDLAFSDQLVEHLHVEDQQLHFRSVATALAPGGAYVFRTPHRFTGPHDVSKYFTAGEPEGFHMKEWTYRELRDELRRAGFARVDAIWSARGRSARVPLGLLTWCEAVLQPLPVSLRRSLARFPFPSIVVAACTEA